MKENQIAEDKLRQLFRANADCYIKVILARNSAAECYVNKQALSEDGFIKLLEKLGNIQSKS